VGTTHAGGITDGIQSLGIFWDTLRVKTQVETKPCLYTSRGAEQLRTLMVSTCDCAWSETTGPARGVTPQCTPFNVLYTDDLRAVQQIWNLYAAVAFRTRKRSAIC
jgi:hypothetical protein